MQAEKKFTLLKDEQLNAVNGAGDPVVITDHDPNHCEGMDAKHRYYHCLDPSDYRCPKDGSEMRSMYEKDVTFPVRIRYSWWWECMFCGAKYAPAAPELTKVDHSDGGGAFRSW